MKAVQIEAFGSPAEVAKVVDVPGVGAPATGEVVITVEASPINQYDLLMIAGGYGYRPQLPAIMGTEGVGRVVAAGAGVKHLKEGDRTLVPFLHPSWAQRVKTDAPWLRPLPPGDINQFAMMGVNPPTSSPSRPLSGIPRSCARTTPSASISLKPESTTRTSYITKTMSAARRATIPAIAIPRSTNWSISNRAGNRSGAAQKAGVGDREEIGRGRRPANPLLSARHGLPAAAAARAYDHGQQHL
jgi:Alcohol dehydrogenase GroES-like domain